MMHKHKKIYKQNIYIFVWFYAMAGIIPPAGALFLNILIYNSF